MESPRPPFHPDWLAAQEAMGGFTVLPVEPAVDSRKKFDAIFDTIKPLQPPINDAVVSSIDIDVNNTGLKVRVFTPVAAIRKGKPLPVGLYIHAGGWFAGGVEHEDPLCRYVAEKAEIILFSPEYRLAPENPYPAGLDDCCAAYEYMHHNADKFGGDASRKTTMGGSAAGNLALAVALKYADTDMKAVGLISACLVACEPSVLPEEYKKTYTPDVYLDSPMIGPEIVAEARRWYNAPASDPLYSVLLHPNLKLIPKIYITACTKDPTHQETYYLSEQCKKVGGVQVDYVEWVGWPHYFWVLPQLPKSKEFIDVWCEKLGWLNA